MVIDMYDITISDQKFPKGKNSCVVWRFVPSSGCVSSFHQDLRGFKIDSLWLERQSECFVASSRVPGQQQYHFGTEHESPPQTPPPELFLLLLHTQQVQLFWPQLQLLSKSSHLDQSGWLFHLHWEWEPAAGLEQQTDTLHVFTQIGCVVLQLLRKLVLVGGFWWNHFPVFGVFEDGSVPVVSAHRPEQNAILKGS